MAKFEGKSSKEQIASSISKGKNVEGEASTTTKKQSEKQKQALNHCYNGEN